MDGGDGLRNRDAGERAQRNEGDEEHETSSTTFRRPTTTTEPNQQMNQDVDSRSSAESIGDNEEEEEAHHNVSDNHNRSTTAPGHNPTGPVDANSRLHRDDERFIDMLNENTLQWRTLLSTMMGFVTSRIRMVLSHTPGLSVHVSGTGSGQVPVFEANASFSNDWTEREIPEELTNPNPTQIHQVRQRLFRTIFTKIVLLFVITFPARVRKLFEYSLLAAAIFSLFMLTYLHVVFVRRPRNCLEGIQENWTTDGILRLEILSRAEQQFREAKEKLSLEEDISTKFDTETNLLADTFIEKGISALTSSSEQTDHQDSNSGLTTVKEDRPASNGGVQFTNEAPTANSNVFGQIASALFDYSFPFSISNSTAYENNTTQRIKPNSTNEAQQLDLKIEEGESDTNLRKSTTLNDDLKEESKEDQKKASRYFEKLAELEKLHKSPFSNEQYAVEYSLEHGFLRLSAKTRQKLNIPTKTVYLDPDEEKCFGDWLSRSLLKYFFGYNDILMNSLKYLAEKENNRGYVHNVITGEHYRFVNIWMTRTSYIAAAFIMLVFTLTISMLLRYSHHQVFVFVAQLTELLEFNTPISFPFAPLLTVILALIGMEAIMTEFFNDNNTAFYIILIVWAADQYDWFCCHTSVTRRNWLKFFYLYHFAFYAYVYRFNGQYADLALLTSFLFILHSMVYFFHHYELPYILSQSARITVTAHVDQNTLISQVSMQGNVLQMRILRMTEPPIVREADARFDQAAEAID